MRWYEHAFDLDYLDRYPHRNDGEAHSDVASILRLLQLEPDAPLLDLCCGAGRHLLAFHAAGLRRLTGLDLSAALLSEARRRCAEAGCEDIETICADMREIPFQEAFAAIVSLFTSFGYFAEDAENARVLEAAHRALRPGGRLLLDLMNREWILSHLVADEEKTLGDMSVRIRRSLDPSSQRVEKTMTYVDGDVPRTIRESVRLFASDEITRMLIGAGFDEIRLYGSLAGEPWGPEPRRMIVVATRPKGTVSS